MSVANALGIAILSQVFLSIEENSYSYVMKLIGKSGQNDYSAVDSLNPTDSLDKMYQ
jgi:hypothetical protein